MAFRTVASIARVTKGSGSMAFEESKHPRSNDGKFTSGGGSKTRTEPTKSSSVSVTVGGTSVPVSRYTNERLAKQNALTTKASYIVLSGDGQYWVTSRKNASYLESHGYEIKSPHELKGDVVTGSYDILFGRRK